MSHAGHKLNVKGVIKGEGNLVKVKFEAGTRFVKGLRRTNLEAFVRSHDEILNDKIDLLVESVQFGFNSTFPTLIEPITVKTTDKAFVV